MHMNTKHRKIGVSKSSATRNENLGDVVAAYENKWVALSPDFTRVLAAGDSVEEVDEQLQDSERAGAVLYKVLPFDAVYAPQAAV